MQWMLYNKMTTAECVCYVQRKDPGPGNKDRLAGSLYWPVTHRPGNQQLVTDGGP